MTPRVDLPFNDYYNLENIEENYDFIETESNIESEYDSSESIEVYQVQSEETDFTTYFLNRNEAETYIPYNCFIRAIEVDEESKEYEMAERNSLKFQRTKNNKYQIHPLADIIRDSWIYEEDNPFVALNYYGLVPYNSRQHKQIHRDYDRIYEDRGMDDDD